VGSQRVEKIVNRIAASAIYRLRLPFQFIARDSALENLQQKLVNVGRHETGAVSINGWQLSYVDAPALISCYETIVVKRWNDFIARCEDPYILDCGANIGITVLQYKKLYPKARIVAFEPDKAICEVLRRNLNANGAEDVEVIEAAVWTGNGPHSFLSEGADGSRLVDKSSDSDGGTKYDVQTVRLADYLDRNHVDFIKLDIEGSESDVLLDCGDRLRNVGSMAIEFHLMSHTPGRLGSALQVLTDAGFNLSVNSYGDWIDLTHGPKSKSASDLSFDQYILVCAWRD